MLIINEQLFEIDDLIDEVIKDFLNLPEVNAYRALKKVFEEDEDLQSKLQLLTDNQDYIAFRPELVQLRKELLLNEKVYQLRVAENDLQELLSELTKDITSAISEHIFVDENLPLKGGSRHGRHH
ncbi:YlbF family regulator [Lactococcus formosensis]|uniref:YlbF family regulator n=1 Tax=Lactococcus formosensis TaxID=1281486 RepID=A0A9X4SHH1_9LACT|nr:YlbF family regulator [Lactococcus formosensis]MDG6141977.1 YlbF family regulator [Lactococcus formosensis]MDG6156568.1 YlbF family regulator [Lactococcus formosensis]MDG6159181.1 YlbF family regulator [Lactococcus formosensis]MDG6165416.1 YlbF family regulator [Lactococcus formosensis]MDG6171869.1 YlbF family regulator [Lactococcus formosensis]